jgi:hypothetical protein
MMIASAILLAPSAVAQEQDHSNHSTHAPATQAQPPAEDHSDHQGHEPPAVMSGHEAHGATTAQNHDMRSALGGYAMNRDASGTAWRPEAARHHMAMTEAGGWMLMGHGGIDLVYTSQSGPRGDDLGFLAGMLMGTAQRRFADDSVLQLRGAISPDPLMGDRGYPLLLAAGETADGVETLVDRQHPHDLFMELSASYSRQLGEGQSVFVYAGLPGEPAFGPPAFMHRPAAEPNPEAPITHHWLDSTHISFGVLTAGYVNGDVKIEASRFRGREPDQDRYDIETGELDSTAVRLSWNPSETWALQASWADVISPEQLEPDVDVVKWSASALYTQSFGDSTLSLSGAFARKDSSEGVVLDAWLGEAALQFNTDWTLFSRVEAIETDELGDHAAHGHHGPIENVARATLGVSRDFRLSDSLVMAIGASATQNWTSGALSPLYDGDPTGALAFVRFRIM